MKNATVTYYGLNIKTSKNFEKKVSSFFPEAKEISIAGLSLFTFSGYGQYRDYLHIYVDGKDLKIYKYHTNSMQKD